MAGNSAVEARTRSKQQRLSARAALAATALAVVLLGAGALGLAGQGTNYEFSKIAVTEDAPGVARVSYTVRWNGTFFPGVYSCTTTVFDANGSVIGENKGLMIALQSGTEASLPVPVSGKPQTADISCDGSRLDQGPYNYTFSNVRVVPAAPGAEYAFSIMFDVAWAGNGVPGRAACTVSVLSQTGALLYQRSMDTVVMAGSAKDQSIIVANDEVAGQLTPTDLVGASATFDCAG